MADTPVSRFSITDLAIMGIAAVGVIAALVAIGFAISATMAASSDQTQTLDLVERSVERGVENALLRTAAGGVAADSAAVAVVGRDAVAPSLATLDPLRDVIPDLTPKAQLQPPPADEVNVSYAPDVPAPASRTDQRMVDVAFEVVENVVALDPATGLEFETWGYKVSGDDEVVTGAPGPMIRARVGDVLRFTITNPAENSRPHNVDFHAVTGQGGGAADTVVAPGETAVIEARLLYPGLYMYHCAYGDVPVHIARGMYGGILVDPADPLPEVELELYMVQSEFYTTSTEPGLAELDSQALLDENPSVVVFNGYKGSMTGDNAPVIDVGDRVRIYFVNAGIDLASNFHPIGSHWDVVYQEASLLSPPIRGSQTTLIPAGGATIVELVGQVPSDIILVDHALTRTFYKGALAIITVQGDENPEIFEAMTNATASSEEPSVTADVVVDILVGSGNQQPLDAADEFAESEAPGDYSVNVLTVPVGTTVEWVNQDSVIHTVTDVDGLFDSGFYGEGESWSYTFTEPGEYEYFCIPHPWMRAKVIVEG